jgi:hypothetical protein
MGRSIEQENTYLQVLLKLIPSEVIAVFVFIQGVMPTVFLPHLIVSVALALWTLVPPMFLMRPPASRVARQSTARKTVQRAPRQPQRRRSSAKVSK